MQEKNIFLSTLAPVPENRIGIGITVEPNMRFYVYVYRRGGLLFQLPAAPLSPLYPASLGGHASRGVRPCLSISRTISILGILN